MENSKQAELSNILLSIAQNLDITKTQYDKLVTSYGAVGKYLEGSEIFQKYSPIITPQGSFRLGTIITPVNEDDDLDIDLVFRLRNKNPFWTQRNIKNNLGERLKDHDRYRQMLQEEGRRCWTLLYRQDSENIKERYHIDILPCVADSDYDERHRQMQMSVFSEEEIKKIAVRITDKETPIYSTSIKTEEWLKSNPDGYAIWFAHRCRTHNEVNRALNMNSIMPLNQYTETKSTLQRIVQLLKRHRDIIFNGDDDKPISIIITTLAARAYKGETDLLEGFCNVVDGMKSYCHQDKFGKYVIKNPVDPEENFADKWVTHPRRKENFFKWVEKLIKDKEKILEKVGVELCETLGDAFGTDLAKRCFEERTLTHKSDAEKSKLKVATTGIMGSVGRTLNAKNTFYGKK